MFSIKHIITFLHLGTWTFQYYAPGYLKHGTPPPTRTKKYTNVKSTAPKTAKRTLAYSMKAATKRQNVS